MKTDANVKPVAYTLVTLRPSLTTRIGMQTHLRKRLHKPVHVAHPSIPGCDGLEKWDKHQDRASLHHTGCRAGCDEVNKSILKQTKQSSCAKQSCRRLYRRWRGLGRFRRCSTGVAMCLLHVSWA